MAATEEIQVPDIGDFKDVDVIEVLVKPGDRIRAEQSLITLESEKATLEVPAPRAGTVKELKISVGDKVSQGSPILVLEPAEAPGAEAAAPGREQPKPEQAEKAPAEAIPAEQPAPPPPETPPPAPLGPERPPPLPPVGEAVTKAHASPSVRRFARELGADLGRISGSGPKGRVLKEDVQAYVKRSLGGTEGPAPAAGPALPPMPEIDFSQFGPVESRPLTKIQRLSGANLHRNWVNIPHVTQFGEADVTALESFRKREGERLKAEGVRLSLLAFFVKASVTALQRFPDFNSSLDPDGEQLVLKRYFHIGVAVDTPQGLVVPVVRDADRMGLVELSRELAELAEKARARKLGPDTMQGGCFTISSLGGIGGTFFTPIINAPEVAILGVSRAQDRPVYRDGHLEERLILPLSLSFDHRVVDGAAAARFIVYVGELLSDPRRLLL